MMTIPGLQLAPRRMNFSELDEFARAMAAACTGGRDAPYRLSRGGMYGDTDKIEWPDLNHELTFNRSLVHVMAGEGTARWIQLWIEDGQIPARLHSSGDAAEQAIGLQQYWATLGQPRRSWEWLFPTGFLLLLAAALAPLIVMWARRDLSLWLIPPVAGLVVLTFAVCSPMLQKRVAEHRRRRAGLSIDYRMIERVRLDRAANRRLWIQNGVSVGLGAIGGAILQGVLSR